MRKPTKKQIRQNIEELSGDPNAILLPRFKDKMRPARGGKKRTHSETLLFVLIFLLGASLVIGTTTDQPQELLEKPLMPEREIMLTLIL